MFVTVIARHTDAVSREHAQLPAESPQNPHTRRGPLARSPAISAATGGVRRATLAKVEMPQKRDGGRMPQPCTICHHPEHIRVNIDLATWTSVRRIEATYN